MDELIWRQDAIDACLNGICANVYDCVDEIKKLSPAQQWIPCSEKLPDKDGDYLAFARWADDEEYEIQVISFNSCLDGFGFVQEYFDGETLGSLGTETIEADVIAWMPLPEPFVENYSIKTVKNAKDAENYPISEDTSKCIEEINKLLFENGQTESEVRNEHGS